MSLNSRALLLVLCLLGATEVVGQEAVTALDRTLSKTHMRQDTTSVAIADARVQAFAPTSLPGTPLDCMSKRMAPHSQSQDLKSMAESTDRWRISPRCHH